METIGQSFGRRLRRLREERDLSRDKMGDRIGLSSTSIVAIEKGDQWASAETLEKISVFFKVPPAYFFTDEIVRILPTPEEAWEIVGKALSSLAPRAHVPSIDPAIEELLASVHGHPELISHLTKAANAFLGKPLPKAAVQNKKSSPG